jgi:hypothetical protein
LTDFNEFNFVIALKRYLLTFSSTSVVDMSMILLRRKIYKKNKRKSNSMKAKGKAGCCGIAMCDICFNIQNNYKLDSNTMTVNMPTNKNNTQNEAHVITPLLAGKLPCCNAH